MPKRRRAVIRVPVSLSPQTKELEKRVMRAIIDADTDPSVAITWEKMPGVQPEDVRAFIEVLFHKHAPPHLVANVELDTRICPLVVITMHDTRPVRGTTPVYERLVEKLLAWYSAGTRGVYHQEIYRDAEAPDACQTCRNCDSNCVDVLVRDIDATNEEWGQLLCRALVARLEAETGKTGFTVRVTWMSEETALLTAHRALPPLTE